MWLTRTRLLRVSFGVLLVVCTVEVAVRLYLGWYLEKVPAQSKFRFDSYRVYAHRPGFTEGDRGHPWIIINGQGFRRTGDVTRAKPQGAFRAFLLGGSAAHGTSSAPPFPIRHVYNDEMLDAVLERRLKERYPGRTIEIINAAVTGYRVFQHTQYLLSELVDYKPDLVIFIDGANDHYTVNPKFDTYRDYEYQFWKPRLQSASLRGGLDYFALFLSNWSATARGYYAWSLNRDAGWNHEVTALDTPTSPSLDDRALVELHKQAAQTQFLRNIEVNLVLLQHFGVRAVVVLQPMLVLRNQQALSGEERGFVHLAPAARVTRVLYPTVRDEVSSLSRKYDVPFVDLVARFSEKPGEQLFIDYCHLTPAGHELAATVLGPVVERVVDERFAKRAF